jgi:hypothetical protein
MLAVSLVAGTLDANAALFSELGDPASPASIATPRTVTDGKVPTTASSAFAWLQRTHREGRASAIARANFV